MMTSHQTSVAEPIVKAQHTVNIPLMNEEECMEIKNRVNILLVSAEQYAGVIDIVNILLVSAEKYAGVIDSVNILLVSEEYDKVPPLFLPDFNKYCIFSIDFRKILKRFMKIQSKGAELFHAVA
jgi:hypothetical protein